MGPRAIFIARFSRRFSMEIWDTSASCCDVVCGISPQRKGEKFRLATLNKVASLQRETY